MSAPEFPDRTTQRALLAVTAVAIAYWAVVLLVLRVGAPSPLDDLWEYALAARELLAGRVFRTSAIHPPLWGLRDAALTVPVLVHGPLPSLALLPFVAVLGDSAPFAGRFVAAAFAVYGARLAFRLAARRFGAATGLVAALLWTGSPLLLASVHHDLSIVMGAALLAAALDLLLRDAPRPLAAGFALGLFGLVRAEGLFVAPLVAIAAGRGAPRTLAGFVATMLPWWAHHALATGNPFFNLSAYMMIGYQPSHPELSPMRDFALTPARWPGVLSAELPHLAATKWPVLFPHAVKRVLMSPSGGTGWLVVIGALGAFRDRAARPFVALSAALLALSVALQTVTLFDERYVAPFLAPLAVLAAAGLAWLWQHLPSWARTPRARLGAAALLLAPSLAPALKQAATESRELERRAREMRAALAPSRARPGVLEPPMFSNFPDFTAWWTHRSTLWVTKDEYQALRARAGADPSRPHPGAPEDAFFDPRPMP